MLETAEEALSTLKSAITSNASKESLTDIQASVFCQCWEGCSYVQIADNIGYEPDYVKKVGFQLWQDLSNVLGVKVSKKNLKTALKQYLQDLQNSEQLTSKKTSIPEQIVSFRDWGDAVSVSLFWGRADELSKIQKWILTDRCSLVTLLGIGGVGKTVLSIKLAQQIQDEFSFVIWRSLRDMPPLMDLLTDLLKILSDQQLTELPDSPIGMVSLLLQFLRQHRCLILLDNLESLLKSGEDFGRYQAGYEAYGELFSRIGEVDHNSCLLLTGRELSEEVAVLAGDLLPVRVFNLEGLESTSAKEILRVKGLSGSEAETTKLVDCYQGNPLALKIAATSIQDLFAGKISEFLDHENIAFNGIRRLLDQQLKRLSDLEAQILYWLAINREPVSVIQLENDFVQPVAKASLLEALEFLNRRSLIEKVRHKLTEERVIRFSQQPVVMEYMIEKLIEHFFEIISTGSSDALELVHHSALARYTLIKAQTNTYIRESQIRVLLAPLTTKLLSCFGTIENIAKQIKSLLKKIQLQSAVPNYSAGNLLNLCIHLNIDLTSYDFSQLAIRQAYLQETNLRNLNFSNADFSQSVFAHQFGGIVAIAFSSCGNLIATGDTNNNIQLRNAIDGQLILSLHGHTGWVDALIFNQENTKLFSGSIDGSIKEWDLQTGKCRRTLLGHNSVVYSLDLSPIHANLSFCETQILASSGHDNTVKFWDIQSGKCIKSFLAHPAPVYAITFDPNGQSIFTASEDQTLKQWDLETGHCLQTFVGHTKPVWSVAMSPDGQTFVSASFDHTVKLWNIQSGRCLKTLRGHQSMIRPVVFSPDGQTVASGGFDQSIRLWDPKTGACLQHFLGHSDEVVTLAFSPDAQTIVSGSFDQTIRVWDINAGRCLRILQGYSNGVKRLIFMGNDQTLVSGSDDGSVRIWDLHTGKCIKELLGHTSGVWSLVDLSMGGQGSTELSPDEKYDGQLIASAGMDQTIKIWDSHSGQCLKTISAETRWIKSIAAHPSNNTIASFGIEPIIRLFDMSTGQCIKTLPGHSTGGGGWEVIFSPDGTLIATAGNDQTVKIWDVQSEKCLLCLSGHSDLVYSVLFAPQPKSTTNQNSNDGNESLESELEEENIPFSYTLASCSGDGTIKIWNGQTGTCINTLVGHQHWVMAIAFSPDGHLLASGSGDETVRVWDVKTGQCLQTYSGHRGMIWSVVFSGDGKTIASSSQDSTIKIWDIHTQRNIETLKLAGPYEGMNINQVTGLTDAQKANLISLGAVEN